MRGAWLGGALATVLLAACRSASVSAPPPLPEGARVLARFADARALAATPAGLLTVADAGRVVLLGPEGAPRGVLAAGGAADGLLDPVAIDPTNGLAFFVADAEAGRVLRFTPEGALAEVIRIEPDAAAPGRPSEQGPGAARPVGVAAGSGGTLYVTDGSRRALLRLDRARRIDAVWGGPDAGAAALRRPGALALGPDGALFVADAAQGVVLRFDALGTPAGALAAPTDDGRLGVAVARSGPRTYLLVATSEAVAVYTLDTAAWPEPPAPTFCVVPALGEPLVAAALVRTRLLVLTPTRLVDLGRVDLGPAPAAAPHGAP